MLCLKSEIWLKTCRSGTIVLVRMVCSAVRGELCEKEKYFAVEASLLYWEGYISGVYSDRSVVCTGAF